MSAIAIASTASDEPVCELVLQKLLQRRLVREPIRGTASDRCAITSSLSSTRTTLYVDVGFTAPSATIAAAFVRTDLPQIRELRCSSALHRQDAQQRRRRLPQLHRISDELLRRRRRVPDTASAFCPTLGGMNLARSVARHRLPERESSTVTEQNAGRRTRPCASSCPMMPRASHQQRASR